MMRLIFVALVWLCSLSVHAAGKDPDEFALRMQISQSATQAFLASDFDALEEQSKHYRADKSRTPSGVWRLTMFYSGVGYAIQTAADADGAKFGRVDGIAKQWVKAYPNSPSAHIAQSMVLTTKAWTIRGRGLASTVQPQAWEPFKKNLALARDNLEKHKAIAAKDPEWYGMMLKLARDENWERARFDALFDEAVVREPQYYQNYFSAMLYLQPKWHGDIDQIDAFVRSAVARTAKREGQGMYARLYWYAAEITFEDGQLFEDSRAQWPLMKAGFDDVVAKYPDPWNINSYAKFACQAKDRKKFGELLPLINNQPAPDAWDNNDELKNCIEWFYPVLKHTRPAADSSEPRIACSWTKGAAVEKDAKQAMSAARNAWISIYDKSDGTRAYGPDNIAKFEPYTATLKDGVWHIRGTNRAGQQGDMPIASVCAYSQGVSISSKNVR